jgi:hypothetical protein
MVECGKCRRAKNVDREKVRNKIDSSMMRKQDTSAWKRHSGRW